MILNKEIKQRVDLLLDNLHLTQGQLSIKLGFSNGNGLSMIMRGKNELNERHLLLLENTFNVNRNWLLNGEGNMFIENSNIYNENKSPNPNNLPTINNSTIDPMTQNLIQQMLDIISRQQDEIHQANLNVQQAQLNQANLIAKIPGGNVLGKAQAGA